MLSIISLDLPLPLPRPFSHHHHYHQSHLSISESHRQPSNLCHRVTSFPPIPSTSPPLPSCQRRLCRQPSPGHPCSPSQRTFSHRRFNQTSESQLPSKKILAAAWQRSFRPRASLVDHGSNPGPFAPLWSPGAHFNSSQPHGRTGQLAEISTSLAPTHGPSPRFSGIEIVTCTIEEKF